jgi:hypothetical protein
VSERERERGSSYSGAQGSQGAPAEENQSHSGVHNRLVAYVWVEVSLLQEDREEDGDGTRRRNDKGEIGHKTANDASHGTYACLRSQASRE